jgi:hypothetical protein
MQTDATDQQASSEPTATLGSHNAPLSSAQWDKVPAVTVSAAVKDPRIPLAVEAVEF